MTEPNSNNNNHKGEDAERNSNTNNNIARALPFVTVSNVVNCLNAGLQQQQQRIASGVTAISTDHSCGAGGSGIGGGFIRAAKATARRATAVELAAADCDTWMRQAAMLVHKTLATLC